MKARIVEFQPPEGLIPDDMQPCEEFEAKTLYRLNSNGTVTIISIEQYPMPQ